MSAQDTAERLLYALAKQVPDMARGFFISTAYGDIEVTSENAAPFVKLMKRQVEKQRAIALKEMINE